MMIQIYENNRILMSHNSQSDLIGFKEVAAKIPKFMSKLPHLVTGLKQAYLRTSNSPAGLSRYRIRKRS